MMKDKDKTKDQLTKELVELRQRTAELEASETQRKLAEEALRESEEKFRSISAFAQDGIIMMDNEGNISYWNEAAEKIFGYTKEEAFGREVHIFLGPERYHEAYRKRFKRFKKTGKGPVTGKTLELSAIRKDGVEFPIELSVSSVKIRGKWHSIGIVRDISERKRMEEALQESEEKYRTLIESSIDGIGLNVDGRIVFGSLGLVKMLGYDRLEELISRPIESVVIPEDREKIKARYLKRLREQITRDRYEFRGLRKDGTTMDIEGCFNTISYQGKPAVLAILRDITENKRMMMELEESEEKYRSLFENANDAIFIADTETGIILDANRQAEQLISCPREEIIGMHQSKLHPPHYAEYYKEKFCKHVQNGRIFDLEAEVIKKDGSIIPVVISANVISLRGKEVIQGIFRDITQERKILDLREEIEARKLIEKAKGILMNRHKIGEKEAMRRLQKESRRQSKKIKEVSQSVISSKLIFN